MSSKKYFSVINLSLLLHRIHFFAKSPFSMLACDLLRGLFSG
ncbi:hypothetical protein O59_000153 [Cellvibrio sp. BR]|nr:hypothetical protein O59_000153 [Cellvibrio sp. BR]